VLIPLLRRHLRPYRGPIAVVVLFQLAQTIANLYLPGLNAEIIDDGVVRGDVGRIWTTGGVMLLVTVLQVACTVVAVYVGARVAMALGRDLRAGVFDAVEGFAARELAHFGAPTLVTRATNDVQQVQLLVFMALTLLVSAPIMAVGGVAMALRQDVELSGLLVVVIPVLVVAVGLIIRTMRPLFRQMQERIDGLNDVMREQIQGIRVVRAFATEEREAERFARANQAYVDVAVAAGRVMALMFPTVMLVMNVSVVAATWFGGYRIASGDLQVGTLTAFQNYLVQILMAVMMATFMLMLWPRCRRNGSPRSWRPSRASSPRRTPTTPRWPAARWRCATPPSPTREPSRTCCTASPSSPGRGRPPRSSGRPAAGSRRWSTSCHASST
jgi:ATP-binding cassette, subfamily B, multidrug efflux pump